MSWLQSLVSAPGLFDLALKSAAVMLLALVAVVLLRRASAAWRHLVWCLGVASLLLLPALALALPAWRVSWLPQWAAEQSPLAVTGETTPAPVDQLEPLVAQSPTVNDTQPPVAARATETRDAAALEAQTALPAAAVETAGPARGSFLWPAIAWAAGGLLSLVPLVVGLWQLAALHRRSRVIDQPCWLNLVDEVRRKLNVRRTVQLRRSATAVLPFTWGVLPPVLLLPAEADGWAAERRRLVLLHELAHVRRWDWLTQLVAHVACAMYWFNPLVWLAARQMRIERERASDDLVLACGVRASDFAQELLTLAAGLTELRLSTLVAVPMARRGALEDRLRGILDSRRSRTAITTAAVCLGMVLAAAAAAPLAMLRAAPPDRPQSTSEQANPADEQPPAGEPAAEKPAQRDPTPEEIAARASGIRISVLNAKGDRGITEFRVLVGVSAGSVSGEFEKRTGQAVINWQPHTCRIGKEGDYVWPLAKAYDEMALRVEADGYQPQVATGIKKAKGRQHVVFLLAEDKGVAGRVLTPDGKPATGATVALALAQKEIVWEGGKLRGEDQPLPEKPGDRWRRPLIVKTDAAGEFRLPTEIEPAAVLVIHESGVLEMAYDAWKKSPELTLQRWGSIAGQVLWQDKPGADEEVTLSVHRDEYGYPGMIASYETARTGKDGKFTFDRVLPGLVQISRPMKPAEPNTTGISAVILNGMFQHVSVIAGDATSVVLGGQGRRVTGKFVGLDSREGATYHFHPEAPHIGFGGDDASWKAFGQLKASSIGPLLFRDKQPINKDGTFTIENMLPGRYQIFLSAPGFTRYAASTQVVVDPEVPGQKPAPVDLKEIATVNKPADAAPGPADKPVEKPVEEKPVEEKPAEQPTAKTVAFRGKVVDSVTGKPIEKFVVQAGRFVPADPKNVTWGYKEDQVSARDGSFSTTIHWGEGWVQTGPTDASKGYSSTIHLAGNWTARIVADGYYPQPLFSSAPPAEKDKREVTVRLSRVPDKVRGVVLDHTGKPLKGAAVYALGVEGLNLAAGRSWGDPLSGHKRDHAPPVHTDEKGRFEIATGDATRLAVSHERFDAWPAAVPATGDVTIRLPEPARVEIELAIDGADKVIGIIYQFLPHLTPGFQGLQSSRVVTIANPGKLVLDTLPPGKYQFWRGSIRMLDRHLFDLKPGETKAINSVREKGARVRGKVIFPADVKLTSTVVTVLDQTASTVYSSQHPADDGTFLTERIPPGTQHLQAYAYKELTPQEMVLSGPIPPSYQAQMTIEVPAEGELKVEDLELKLIERGK